MPSFASSSFRGSLPQLILLLPLLHCIIVHPAHVVAEYVSPLAMLRGSSSVSNVTVSSNNTTQERNRGGVAFGYGYVEPGKFEPGRALRFAHFSNAAYCSASAISAWSCPPCKLADPGFNATKVIEGTKEGVQVFVGSSGQGDIVVSFRGSENFANWLSNLDFPLRSEYPKCDGCKVHQGFYAAWNEVADRVVAEVERLVGLQPKAQVFVTGHSFGAALAALCAAELGASSKSLGYPIEGVYTYGQPRVGNAAFAEFYGTGEHVSWRVVHWRDTVPHLPLSAMGFRHTSVEVFYTETFDSYTICDGTGEDAKCSDQFDVAVSVSDHLNYLNISISGC